MKPRTPLTETEKEKAAIMSASGQTPHGIGKALARSPHTISKFLDRPETRQQVNIQREELATMFDSVADRTLRAVSDKDIEKSTLQQKMVSSGIAVDKAAMLRGELPATINVTVLADIAAMIRRDSEDEAPPALPHQLPRELPPHDPADAQAPK